MWCRQCARIWRAPRTSRRFACSLSLLLPFFFPLSFPSSLLAFRPPSCSAYVSHSCSASRALSAPPQVLNPLSLHSFTFNLPLSTLLPKPFKPLSLHSFTFNLPLSTFPTPTLLAQLLNLQSHSHCSSNCHTHTFNEDSGQISGFLVYSEMKAQDRFLFSHRRVAY